MIAYEYVRLIDLHVFSVFKVNFDAEDFEQSSKYQGNDAWKQQL